MYIKFSKTRNVKTPQRAQPGDAGIDFYIPDDFIGLTMEPGASVLIPSGIKVEVPMGYAMIFHNKSGVAVNKTLHVGADTVDHGYAGEVHINLTNVGQQSQTLVPGMKIIQALIIPVLLPQLIEVEQSILYRDIHVAGSRGTGGFGSTGTV